MITRPTNMSKLGLGGYPLGGGYGKVTEAEAMRTVDCALDHGITFIDTAETYLESEERLGRILESRRDRIFLATKAFPLERYSFENLTAALEGSLRRLKTDRIDLYQLHGPESWFVSEPHTELAELAESLDRLRQSGKALRIGICNLQAPVIEELLSAADIFSTQNLFSMIDRGEEPDDLHLAVETEIIPLVRAHEVAFIAYSPLSRGLLVSGQDPQRTFGPDDERHYLPRYQPGVFEHYVALADKLDEWSVQRGHTVTELAVAWSLHVPGVISTLIGAKSPEQIEAVAGADSWTLTPDDLAEIDTLVATLPQVAKDAKMVVWDHFDPSVIDKLHVRRYSLS